MGVWEFAWHALPGTLLQLLPVEYTEDESRLPDDTLARAAWPDIRDQWLLVDEQRTAQFAALLDELQVARSARSQAGSDADYLRALRNTAGLRHAIVRYLLEVGSLSAMAAEVADVNRDHDIDAIGDINIPSADFGPRTFTDFTRLASINDLNWGYWLLNSSNSVEALLPGESIILSMDMDGPANNGDAVASVGFMFMRPRDGGFEIIGAPEDVLPQGVTYDPLRERLSNLGWGWTSDGVPLKELPWLDGIDDGVLLIQQTFRSVFLVDGPGRAFQSDEMRPPGGMLPAAPLPNEVVYPASPAELISIIDSIIRAMGGHVIADVDATTHGFRLGEWSGWIHADPQDAILDVVVIALDHTAGVAPLDAARIVELQTRVLRFGRVVVSGAQTLVAASFPCKAFKGESFQTLLIGMIDDAAACVGQSRSVLDIDRSVGGYL